LLYQFYKASLSENQRLILPTDLKIPSDELPWPKNADQLGYLEARESFSNSNTFLNPASEALAKEPLYQ
jgi:hypothetical protein